MEAFIDREDAGRELAEDLKQYGGSNTVVYGLPRGGVATAVVVARALSCLLDLIVVRKIGHPDNPEYAVGAIAEDGVVVLNEAEAEAIPHDWLEREKELQQREAIRRRRKFLAGIPPVPVERRTAIIVDDGIATGYTMEAAILSIRSRHPRLVIAAAPVAPPQAVERLSKIADRVVVSRVPSFFYAIGQFYRDFHQVTDEEVMSLIGAPAMR